MLSGSKLSVGTLRVLIYKNGNGYNVYIRHVYFKDWDDLLGNTS